MNMVNQVANPETKQGPLPRLDWLKRPDFGNVARFAGTIGVAVAFAASFGGASKAGGGKEVVVGDKIELGGSLDNPFETNPAFNSVHNLVTARAVAANVASMPTTDVNSGPRDIFVCAYPKGESCNMTVAKETADGVGAYLDNPQHGEKGFSVRFETEGGTTKIYQVELPIDAAAVQAGAIAAENNSNTLQYAINDKIHQQLGDDPQVEYDVVLTSPSNLGEDGKICGLSFPWNGMNIPGDHGNRNVPVVFGTPSCNKGDDKGNPYQGFKSTGVYMIEQKVHNEGMVPSCDSNVVLQPEGQAGLSFRDNDILDVGGIGKRWWMTDIHDYLHTPGGCSARTAIGNFPNSLDIIPRFDWSLNASGGSFDIYVKDGTGNWAKTVLDAGSRVPAGRQYQLRYTGSGKVSSWTGCEADGNNSCSFIANQATSINAAVEGNPRPEKTISLRVSRGGTPAALKASKLTIKGAGISCPSDCAQDFTMAANASKTERLVATAKNGYKARWVNCGGKAGKVVGNVCTLVFKSDSTARAIATQGGQLCSYCCKVCKPIRPSV